MQTSTFVASVLYVILCPIGHLISRLVSYRSALLSVLQASFNEAVLFQLKQLVKKHKSGSALYRAAFSAQTDYLDQLDDLFPWVAESTEEGGASETKGHKSSTEGKEGGAVEGVKVERSKSSATKASPVQLEW